MRSLFIYLSLSITVLCAACYGGEALAHGTVCSVDESAIMVEAAYHDGSPMAFCDVTVKRSDSGVLLASGSTDGEGRFFFLPSSEVAVTVEVDDGMGHLASVSVDPGASGSERESDGRPGNIWLVVTGLGAIFGTAGIYMMIRSRIG